MVISSERSRELLEDLGRDVHLLEVDTEPSHGNVHDGVSLQPQGSLAGVEAAGIRTRLESLIITAWN
jgi:hypothetical protein